MKLTKRSRVWAKKVLNLWVVLMMLLQPVGTPGLLAIVAADTVATELPAVEQAAPAPVVEEKVEAPAPEPVAEVEPKVEEPKVEAPVPEPVAEVKPIVEAPALDPAPEPTLVPVTVTDPAPTPVESAVVEEVPVLENVDTSSAPDDPANQSNAPPVDTSLSDVQSSIPTLSQQPTVGAIDGEAAAVENTGSAFLVQGVVPSQVQNQDKPTLSTDKNNYKPGEKAIISGENFPGETDVVLRITDPKENWNNFHVNSSVDGNFEYEYVVTGFKGEYLVEALVGDVLLASTTFRDPGNPSADLDQYANTDNDWVNGNLGTSNSTYFEGDSVPYRLKFDNLSITSHTVTIEWDTTKSSKHALDYITSYNASESSDPCDGIAGCSSASTFPIPADPQVTGAGVTPLAGSFTIFGGTITGVSAYTYPDGAGFVGDKSARITVTFSATQANPVLAWAGHISTRADWGLDGAAVAISGSPYHTRLVALDGSGGNQDRSLSAAAVIFPASITIIKDATPNGATVFPFVASPAPLENFSLTDDGTTANTRLFSNITSFTTYSVAENVPVGWSLTGVNCSVTSANGGSQTVSLPNVDIDLEEGENVTCTFSDQQQEAHLIVIKHVINDDGGAALAAAFTMSISGITATGGNSFPGVEAPGVNKIVTPGNYTVTEAGPSGYGDSYSADCAGSISAGETKTCTVTNDDQAATLTVIKHVINDDGGTKTAADFTMNVTGTNVSTASFAGAEIPGTTVTLDAGSYSVDEGSVFGYAKTLAADCSGTIAIGQTKTCTITNNDIQPKLTVIKHVVDDNGGTLVAGNFTMHVSGTNVSLASFPGVESPGTEVTLSAGSYVVSEDTISGYQDSFSGDCSGTINVGEEKTCTVTNDDQAAHLIVIKHVVNDDGGNAVAGDFTMNISGVTVTGTSSFQGVESPGTDRVVDPGFFTVSETAGPSGYAASVLNASCSGFIALGETKTCTIINDDVAPKLTLIKSVINDDGGSAGVDDFGLTIGVTSVDSGQALTLLANAPYAINEAGLAGYSFVSVTGDVKCPGVLGGTVTLDEGDDITCTITNDDQQAYITVVKTVINDNGGNALPDDFNLNLEGNAVSSGVAVPVNPGTYTAGETLLAGYALEGFSGDCDSNGDVTVALGETKTCTITNNDQQSYIAVVKVVNNDDGGSALPDDFNITLEGNAVSSGVAVPVNPGTYTAGETLFAGYSFTGFSGDCDSSGDVTVALGESKTCTLTNDDIAPTLTLVKTVVNNNGGTSLVSDFPLFINGISAISGTAYAQIANVEITATETTQAGYAASVWGGDCGAAGTVTLLPGDNKTCTITNDDNYGTVTVTKFRDDDGDGFQGQNEPILPNWEMDLAGNKKTTDGSGQTIYDLLIPNSYILSETQQDGWNLTNIYCNNDEQATADTSNQHSVAVGVEEQVQCFVGNQLVSPSLTITKSNNKFPVAQTPGSEVTYTINVTANDNDVLGVQVTDLPPAGFVYQGGTAVATQGTLAHVYASPGIWNLGDMTAGQTVTLSYVAKINGDQDPGLYNDLAFANGVSEISAPILASSAAGSTPGDDGIVNDNFVGTKIAVIVPDKSIVALEEDTDTKTKTKRRTKYVLGAELPATGASGMGALLGIILIAAGGALIILKKRQMTKRKITALLFALMLLGGMSISAERANAAAGGLTVVRIEEPFPPSNVADTNNFKIGFVTLDTDPFEVVTAQCFKKGPSDGSFVAIGAEYVPIAGGNSGNCIVDSTAASVDGIYKFKVRAAGSQSVDSAEISVDVEAAVPTTPLNYNRNDDSCTVTFTTAADGITSKVELYRSTEADFIADASTLSATLPIGPNQNGSIADPNGSCSDYLYAIRAVSTSGAGSGFVGDIDVTVRTRTRTTTRTITLPGGQAGGAIPVAAGTGGVVAGEETTVGTGAEGEQGGAGNEGEVLGEETSTNETGGLVGLFEKVWPWLLLLIAAGLVWYGIAKRKKDESSIK